MKKKPTQSIIVLLVLAIIAEFVIWSLVIGVFSWVFGFEFAWRYVVGAWLGTTIIKSIFGGNK